MNCGDMVGIWTHRLAEKSGRDPEWIYDVLLRCLRDGFGRAISEETVAVGPAAPRPILFLELPEAIKRLGVEGTLQFLEQADLDLLIRKLVCTWQWSRPDPLLYTAPEIAVRAAMLHRVLALNEQHLLVTGYPAVVLASEELLTASPVWRYLMNLYPVQVPRERSITVDSLGATHYQYAWGAKAAAQGFGAAAVINRLLPEEAARLVKLRRKALLLKLGLAELVAGAVSLNQAALWEKCKSIARGENVAPEQRLLEDDFLFLFEIDHRFSAMTVEEVDEAPAIAPGGISETLTIVGLYDWARSNPLTQETREILEQAGLIAKDPEGVPRTSVQSYFSTVGTPAQEAIDRAVGRYLTGYDESLRFGTDLTARINEICLPRAPGAYGPFMLVPLERAPGTETAREPSASPDPGEIAGNVFNREPGGMWFLRFEQSETRLRDSKGLRFIQELLRHPGKDTPSIELESIFTTSSRSEAARVLDDLPAEQLVEEGLDQGGRGSIRDPLERDAVARLKRQIEEIAERIELARDANADDRVSELNEQKAAMAEELAHLVGFKRSGGTTSHRADKARKSVTDCIKRVINAIERAHSPLGRHLRQSIRTGLLCRYEPEKPTPWSF